MHGGEGSALLTRLYHVPMAREMDESTKQELIIAIAGREGNARELSERFGRSIAFLKRFAAEHERELELAREALEQGHSDDLVTPSELDAHWISQKTVRLAAYEQVANFLFTDIKNGIRDSTTLREFRAYLNAAAQELGQLLHRGSGEGNDGDKLSVQWEGVDPESFR